jgi:hypothetical protein
MQVELPIGEEGMAIRECGRVLSTRNRSSTEVVHQCQLGPDTTRLGDQSSREQRHQRIVSEESLIGAWTLNRSRFDATSRI